MSDVAIKPNPAVQPVNDETLRLFVGYHLKRAFNIVRSDLAEVLEPLGLRMITYSALVLIVDNPGSRPSRLAAALDIERPNLVVIIDDLEKRGLVLRERSSDDRRAYALTATEAGHRLCAQAVAADKAAEAAMLTNVPESDLATFKRVLEHIQSVGRG